MNIHEYQARELYAAAGIPVPAGEVAATPEEARAIARKSGKKVVVKAQVHAGGRGKAGGVKLAGDPGAAETAARAILGMQIKGLTVEQVLISECCEIENEYYMGITMDRARQRPVIMASAAGGIDIEEVARTTPEKIIKHHIDPLLGLRAYEARNVCFQIEARARQALKMARILELLYQVYLGRDASLAEINPLITTPDGDVLAIDAKINIDDSALFRQRDLLAWREDRDPNEAEARGQGLSYIKLDGNIGCVVNGAGLAMATMDVIKEFGGEPANFLDIGGSSSPEKVTTALEILQRDGNVQAIFFNIFGGITRTDDVANGIVQAFEAKRPQVPVVIRLTGTNEEEARKILTGIGLEATTSMEAGVREVIAQAGGAR